MADVEETVLALLDVVAVGPLSDEQRAEILTRVHAAVVEVLRVPAGDPTVFVRDIPTGHAIVPEAREWFALVRVTMFSGRRRETIAQLIEQLKQAVGAVVGAPEEVTVVVIEAPRDCWSATVGSTAADVELGFEVEV